MSSQNSTGSKSFAPAQKSTPEIRDPLPSDQREAALRAKLSKPSVTRSSLPDCRFLDEQTHLAGPSTSIEEISDHSECLSAALLSCPMQSDVIQFLAHSSAYRADESLAEDELVDRMETSHWVLFSCGQHCYKLRRARPVDGHGEALAERSLNDRFTLTLDELLRGQMFAPDLYLGLCPILVKGDGLSIGPTIDDADMARRIAGGEGRIAHDSNQIIDWLLVLRRYDISLGFDKKADLGGPDYALCSQIAHSLSRCHEAGACDGTFTGDHALATRLARLQSQLDMHEDASWARAQGRNFEQIKQALTRLEPILRHRANRGYSHALHGNLKLSSVVSLPYGLQMPHPSSDLPERTFGDPFLDLAGLLVDFWTRGLSSQANWLLSIYCNRLQSDGLDGLSLLAPFMYLHALERAVLLSCKSCARSDGDAFLSAQTDHRCRRDEKRRDTLLHTAQDGQLEQESEIVVIGGHQSAQRHFLARQIAPAVGRMPGALHLCSEQERMSLRGLFLPDHPAGGDDTAQMDDLLIARLCEKSRYAMEAGYSVVLEAGFLTSHSRANLQAFSGTIRTELGLRTSLFWVTHRDDCAYPDISADMPWKVLDSALPLTRLTHQALMHLSHSSLGHSGAHLH